MVTRKARLALLAAAASACGAAVAAAGAAGKPARAVDIAALFGGGFGAGAGVVAALARRTEGNRE